MRNAIERTKKLYMIVVMALVMAFTAPASGLLPVVTSAQAASRKPSLNRARLTLIVGKTASLKVKNIRGKARWATSNRKVVTVNRFGRIYGRRPGKATIVAKVGNRKLKCLVVVKKAASKKTNRNRKAARKTVNTYQMSNSASWDGITVTATVTNSKMSLTIYNGRSYPISMGWAGSPFYVGVITDRGSYAISEDVLQSLWNTGDVRYQSIQPGQSSTYTCTRDFSVRPQAIDAYNIIPLNESGLPVFDWDSFSYVKYNIRVRF